MEQTQQLRLYRSSHRIQEVDGHCTVDDLRVLPTKGGRLRHDPGQILRLLDVEYGGEWPSKAARVDAVAFEIARDAVRQGSPTEARRDAFEEGRLTFEWHGHAVDVDVAEDDEWTNREGMPEFNGSFR